MACLSLVAELGSAAPGLNAPLPSDAPKPVVLAFGLSAGLHRLSQIPSPHVKNWRCTMPIKLDGTSSSGAK